MNKFKVFTRTFWKENKDWPNGLEPHMGRKTTIGYAKTEAEAIKMCQDYNNSNDPGRYSREAEFTQY